LPSRALGSTRQRITRSLWRDFGRKAGWRRELRRNPGPGRNRGPTGWKPILLGLTHLAKFLYLMLFQFRGRISSSGVFLSARPAATLSGRPQCRAAHPWLYGGR
jgi:hypothetical protein